jgi:hypothetical protein
MQTYLVPSNAGSGSFQYLLICGGVVSRTEWQSTGMGGSTKVLYHALSFLLWDNVNNKVVSYAAFEKNVPTFIVPVMTKDTWLRMMNDLAKVIVSGTPYKKLN